MRTLLTAALLSLALPASAGAKLRPYIPPGNSGANEYVESVPTAGGERSIRNVTPAGDAASALLPSTQSALVRDGADGRATAELANATAPRRSAKRVHIAGAAGGGLPGGGAGPGASDSGGSPVGGVVRSLLGLEGQGGLGGALLVILIATLLALGAGRVWRRRTTS